MAKWYQNVDGICFNRIKLCMTAWTHIYQWFCARMQYLQSSVLAMEILQSCTEPWIYYIPNVNHVSSRSNGILQSRKNLGITLAACRINISDRKVNKTFYLIFNQIVTYFKKAVSLVFSLEVKFHEQIMIWHSPGAVLSQLSLAKDGGKSQTIFFEANMSVWSHQIMNCHGLM